jgi:hypothetical protein
MDIPQLLHHVQCCPEPRRFSEWGSFENGEGWSIGEQGLG